MIRFTCICFALVATISDVRAQETEGVLARQAKVADLPELLELYKKQTHCFPKQSPTSEAICSLGKPAVPHLITKLEIVKDSTWPGQARYAFLVGLIGADAKGAKPALNQLLERKPRVSPYIEHYVAAANASIDSDLEKLEQLANVPKDYGDVASILLEHAKKRSR